jgi:hypothetical protein
LEKYRHRHARELETQRAKEARETVLYEKRCESYSKLSVALNDFNEKTFDVRLISRDQALLDAVICEIEESWRSLNRVISEGHYSPAVQDLVDQFMKLECWEDLRTQKTYDPIGPKISEPFRFFKKVLNLKALAHIRAIGIALNDDMEQRPPQRFIFE